MEKEPEALMTAWKDKIYVTKSPITFKNCSYSTIQSSTTQEGNAEMETKQPKTVEEIRSVFNGILTSAEAHPNQLSNIVRVIDMGETQKIIVDVMTTVSQMSRNKEENVASRWLRKIGLDKVVDKTKDSAVEALTEGQTVAEVSQRLLKAITNKKDEVSSIMDQLFDLKQTMLDSYQQMQAIVEGIDENWDDFNERDQFHLGGLKAEILETMSHHRDNITSAAGTIKAAELANTQISQMIPKLRSQINDSMSIRGSLEQLRNLTELCQTVGDACAEMRVENRQAMESTLIEVLDRSVISKPQLALIENNLKEQERFQKRLTDKFTEVTNSLGERTERLAKAVQGNNASLIEFAKDASYRDAKD
ncbi:hypothetical protein phiA829_141 [Aeromonas phage phiA8-29]|uniref:Uncharacterized protein n=1 Tax=Aeromonas phage phiA8-29 TaxID=1978922 RepID=A0A1W6DYH8_9CAUD|nr:hypothetical protein HWB15_gp136 [Aeromonas phage phiA8-29]ARK07961.1 hypothetical protein phiA829_141 [Aeromonas phage phiA8-29]